MNENTVLTKVKIISKCGSVVKCEITILMYVCLNSGGVAFETFQPCRKSSTFVQICRKIFHTLFYSTPAQPQNPFNIYVQLYT
jgi:hypothetical protein